MPHTLDKGRGLVDSITVKGALRVGVAGSDLKAVLLLSASLSPAEVAANTSAEQTFTLTGVLVGDIISVVKPTAQAGLGIVGVRVSATDQVAITFGNFTAAPIVPTAAESYKFLVARP